MSKIAQSANNPKSKEIISNSDKIKKANNMMIGMGGDTVG
jgi:hypothetical protein